MHLPTWNIPLMIKIQTINEGWFKQPYMSTLNTKRNKDYK